MPITVRKATLDDVDGICRVCTEGYWATYSDLMPSDYIERTVATFYNPERVRGEVLHAEDWNGWYVALDGGTVVGAGGGGMTGPAICELFVLYLDPTRRREGIGTLLLDAITAEMREQGAHEQWVSVAKGNMKGIPFYEARGFVLQGEQATYASLPEDQRTSLRMCRPL
jgi:ribosomal protein S18 acetylase RimI-like enzyme